jgi:tellurite resistance protein TehA-like permease
MLATFPAGLLIISVAWSQIGPWIITERAALTIVAVLLVMGAVIAFVLSAAWATSISRSGAGLEGVNGGWLIPPVINLIVPLGLAPLAIANPGSAELLLVIGFAFLGIGAVLFLALLSLLVARLALRPVFPAQMAPSLWIPLAPAGMLGLSTLRLMQWELVSDSGGHSSLVSTCSALDARGSAITQAGGASSFRSLRWRYRSLHWRSPLTHSPCLSWARWQRWSLPLSG